MLPEHRVFTDGFGHAAPGAATDLFRSEPTRPSQALYDIRKLLAFADAVDSPARRCCRSSSDNPDGILEKRPHCHSPGCRHRRHGSSEVHYLGGWRRRLGGASRTGPGRPGTRAMPAIDADEAAHSGPHCRRGRAATPGAATLRVCPQHPRRERPHCCDRPRFARRHGGSGHSKCVVRL